MATEARVPHATFPEGALSPDGGMQQARFGLFSYVTKYFDPTTSPDIVVIPIGTNYDRVPEDNNMVNSNSAEFKARGKPFVVWSGIQIRCADTHRNFAAPPLIRLWPVPISAGQYRFVAGWKVTMSIGRGLIVNNVLPGSTVFGEELMAEVHALLPVPPVAVLCWVLLQAPVAGLNKAELLSSFKAAIAHARTNAAFVVLPRSDEQFALQQALELTLLRGMIRYQANGMYLVNPDKQVLVAYYAKSIEHHLEPN